MLGKEVGHVKGVFSYEKVATDFEHKNQKEDCI